MARQHVHVEAMFLHKPHRYGRVSLSFQSLDSCQVFQDGLRLGPRAELLPSGIWAPDQGHEDGGPGGVGAADPGHLDEVGVRPAVAAGDTQDLQGQVEWVL